MERTAANRHVFLRMVGEVEMSCDWFGSVFIVDLNNAKVFAETDTETNKQLESEFISTLIC